MRNKVVREIVNFVKGHQVLFDNILREEVHEGDELTMELINLVIGILSKVNSFGTSRFFFLVKVAYFSLSSFIACYVFFASTD